MPFMLSENTVRGVFFYQVIILHVFFSSCTSLTSPHQTTPCSKGCTSDPIPIFSIFQITRSLASIATKINQWVQVVTILVSDILGNADINLLPCYTNLLCTTIWCYLILEYYKFFSLPLQYLLTYMYHNKLSTVFTIYICQKEFKNSACTCESLQYHNIIQYYTLVHITVSCGVSEESWK
jgi:hypothetical protein